MNQGKRIPLNAGPSFSALGLAALMQEKVLGGGKGMRPLVMPAPDALAALAGYLNLIKADFLDNQNVEVPLEELQREARRLIVALTGNLVQRRDLYDPAARDAFERAIADLHRQFDLPDMFRSFGSTRGTAFDEGAVRKTWQYYSIALRGDFVNAMLTTNPGFDPGISQSGPMARYLAAVAPHVTGEVISTATIGLKLMLMDGAPD